MQDAKSIWLPFHVGLQCILVCLPVLLFQFSGWLSFCHKGIVERPWCSTSLPNIYSFVQSHYWGVGFLQYFKLQQVISPAGCRQGFHCISYLTKWSHCLLLLNPSDSDAVECLEYVLCIA